MVDALVAEPAQGRGTPAPSWPSAGAMLSSRRCDRCRYRVQVRARFCERCGTRLLAARGASTGIAGERRQVTVMYTDIVGSMKLMRALEAERWGLVLDQFLGMAAGAVRAHGGTVNQFTGDGLLAVFGAPLAQEDHAGRACRAALELQRGAARLTTELACGEGVGFAARCGLNSGDVVVGWVGADVHMDFVPLGITTALGKRIESLAPAGSTAISAATAGLVGGEFDLRTLGEFEVKGLPDHQHVLELITPKPGFAIPACRRWSRSGSGRSR